MLCYGVVRTSPTRMRKYVLCSTGHGVPADVRAIKLFRFAIYDITDYSSV